MKKILSLFALVCCLVAVGCGSKESENTDAAPQPKDGGKVEADMNKNLIGGETAATGGGGGQAPAVPTDATPTQATPKPDGM